MLFYLVTFGGFVLVGSMFRPIGGLVADRIGGVRALQVPYSVVVLAMLGVALSSGGGPLVPALVLFLFGMMAMGNGAVFQLLPQRFGKQIGTLTGLVGMAGGLGGFYLASSLGLSKQWTGDYRFGFVCYALLGAIAYIVLLRVKVRRRATWGSPAVARARV